MGLNEHLVLLDDPVFMAVDWIREAKTQGCPEHDAMALATASTQGVPSVRFVLFKGEKDGFFYFYTNYESRKAKELLENPTASLAFFWPQLKRQIRIEGAVEKTTRAESEAYFASRARISQIGAWASSQSQPIAGHNELMQKFDKFEQQFKNQDIPCPPHWGGFKLKAHSIEFWLGTDGRLHERVAYTKTSASGSWTKQWLSP